MSGVGETRGGAVYTVSYADNPSEFAAVAGRLRQFATLSDQAQKLARGNILGAKYRGGAAGAVPTAGGAIPAMTPVFTPLQQASRNLTSQINAHARSHRSASQWVQAQARATPSKPATRNIFAGLEAKPGMTREQWQQTINQRMERYGGALGAGVELNPDERKVMAHTRAMRAVLGQQGKAENAPPATRNLFAGLEGNGSMTNKQWNTVLKKRMEVETEAVKNGTEFNTVEKGVVNQSRRLQGLLKQGNEGGIAGKVASAIGWAPIPGGQNAYMMQMALESMGLSGTAVLAGTIGTLGAAAGAAGYVGVSNVLATQTQQSRTIAGMTGGNNANAPSPVNQALAKQVRDIGYKYSLTEGQTYALLPTLGQFNLPNQSASIPQALNYGLAYAGQNGLTPQQGVQAIGLQMARTQQTAQQAANQLQRMNDAAQQLHVPLQQVGQDFLSMGGSLTSSGSMTGIVGLSALGQQLGITGSQLGAGFMNSTGMQAMQQAAMLGMTQGQFTADRQSQGGPTTIAEAFMAKVRAQPTLLEAQTWAEMGGFVQPGSSGENQMIAAIRNGTANPAAIQQQLAALNLPSGAALTNETNANIAAAQNISADTVDVKTRMAIITEQAGNAVATAITTPGTPVNAALQNIAAASLVGSGVPTGAAPAPGNTLPPGQMALPGPLRVVMDLTDEASRLLKTLTGPTGSTTRTPTLTPGQATPPNVGTVPPRTPTSNSLGGP